MMKDYKYLIILLLLISLPLWSFLIWAAGSSRPVNIVVVDKTAGSDFSRHNPFFWILNHQKYTRPDNTPYDYTRDYFGFFPLEGKKYRINGLEKMDTIQLSRMAQKADIIYLADQYGVSEEEWTGKKSGDGAPRFIYGGLSESDLFFASEMKKAHKMIIAEFSTMASPTIKDARLRFENLFGVRWTGWNGKFFSNLDAGNSERLPGWLIPQYRRQHSGRWPFSKAGIVLVSSTGRIEVMEEGKHLREALPALLTNRDDQGRFGISYKERFDDWFEINLISRKNRAVSVFNLETTQEGSNLLHQLSLPNPFPAVIEHFESDYKFYYFSGEFCTGEINKNISKFTGGPAVLRILNKASEAGSRSRFFWDFYYPLISSILKGYTVSAG